MSGDAESVLKAAREAYDKVVTEQAARVREELVVPICKKLGCTFSAGMGSFEFSIPADDVCMFDTTFAGSVYDLQQLRKRYSYNHKWDELEAVLKVLELDVYSFNHGTEGDPMSRLGYYVEDVR